MKKIPLMSDEIRIFKAKNNLNVLKKKKAKKRKQLVSGERFYFIYPSDVLNLDKDTIDINCPEHVLTIGDAESYSPEHDMKSNCFRTKAEARKALSKINKILKGKL